METFASALQKNIADLRRQRLYTVRSLADRLAELGQPVHPSGITKMENGTRTPSALEVVALALALNVNVSRLLMPFTASSNEQFELPGVGKVSAFDMWLWADGWQPLDLPDDENTGRALLDFQLHARPPQLVKPEAREDWERLRNIRAAKGDDASGEH
ncbi:helix-turn-helix domain-containing protein [Prauserella sp. PE36]|uniref:helix-turn-helix domain-containing protein n=1 Tax=Prauserella sp. PE36 TaxID=1504709 RepID=UPI0013143D21|nr:helix-turn-helix transcriptional regulator [Prauserella sp. PE36]